LLFSCFFSVSSLKAQDTVALNTLGLQYGIHFFTRQDLIFSPMVYHATSFTNLNLNYSNEKSERMHLVEAEFNLYDASWHDQYDYQTGFDTIKTVTTLPSGFTVVTVRYGFLRHVATASSGTWWVGGMVDNQINSIDNQYGPASTFGYFAHFSLAPAVLWKHQLSDRSGIYASAWLPLISWVTRSAYAIADDEYMQQNNDHNGLKTFFRYLGDGNFHLINRYQQINFNAGYTYSFASHWSIGGEYRLEFLHDSKPKSLISYQNFINLKAAYLF
jgi:hypothetical protein